MVATTTIRVRRPRSLAANGERPLRLTVEITTTDDPLRGRLLHDDSPEEPFTGWLGLLSALQGQVRRRAEADGASSLDRDRSSLNP